MMTISFRNPCGRPARYDNTPAPQATIVVAVAWLLGGLLPAPAGAEVLRWTFKAGEVLNYSIDTKTQMTARGADREHKSSRSLIIDMSWTVRSVGPGGDAEITQRINRVREKVEQAPYMPFEFDSSGSKPVPEGFEGEAKYLKSLVGLEFTFAMKPTGEIGEIKFPEQTLKAVREAAPPQPGEAGAAQEVPEKALKEMLLQSSPPSFPAGDLQPGKTWKSKPARIPSPVGIVAMEKSFTFQGPDPKAPHLLLVGIDTKVAVEPVEGVTTTIRKQEGKGSMTLDTRSGHMTSVRSTHKLDMTVAPKGAPPLDQVTETTTSMDLVPPG
jgi:hypothetical protein